MSDLTLLPSNAVEVSGARTFTTSLMVAEVFGKQHGHVLRDIDGLDCSPEFRKSNFGCTFQDIPGPNNAIRQERAFEITKDGFTFLVMGYTGAKAAQFKEAYIKRFNELEAQARTIQPAIRDGARFLAVVRDGRWSLEEIPRDSFVLPADAWPGVIQSPDFPKELLPDVLAAVSDRMKRLPGQAISPRQNSLAAPSGSSGYVAEFIGRHGADGVARRDLIAGCKPYRNLTPEQRNALIDKLIDCRSIFEIEIKRAKGRPGKRLVAAKFVRTQED